jgi:hypothetical protein
MTGVVVLSRTSALSAEILLSFESDTPSPSKEGLTPEEDAFLASVLNPNTGSA